VSRPLWLVELLKRVYPARFLVAQSTRIPLLGKVVGRFFFRGDNMVYLPRDGAVRRLLSGNGSHGAAAQGRGRTVDVQREIRVPEDVVLPSKVLDYFIEQASDLWIMDACLCRQSEGCKDFPIDLGCLFMGRAVSQINPSLGRRVMRQEARAHVRRAREAGLVHLIGRNKLDSMWLGAGPGHQLLTVCNCCPCCCLFGVLPHLDKPLRSKITRMPGVQVTVTDRCVGCGACASGICFVDAIQMVTATGRALRAQIREDCVGCGRCVDVCPEQAIEISGLDGEFVQRAIARLSPSIDVT
jgi:ferredoxin